MSFVCFCHSYQHIYCNYEKRIAEYYTDHCNSYILLCEVIAITTVTLIELKCCYDISLVHGNKQHCYCDNTV